MFGFWIVCVTFLACFCFVHQLNKWWLKVTQISFYSNRTTGDKHRLLLNPAWIEVGNAVFGFGWTVTDQKPLMLIFQYVKDLSQPLAVISIGSLFIYLCLCFLLASRWYFVYFEEMVTITLWHPVSTSSVNTQCPDGRWSLIFPTDWAHL